MKKIYSLIVFLVFVTFILSSCSSGGGSAPLVLPPPTPTAPTAPTGVSATAGNGQATIAWTAVSGATSYNIYWSTTTGVTPANGTKITGATSPYTQTGLNDGTHYYYVVTAVNGIGESAASAQASCTPSTSATLKVFVTSVQGTGDLHSWTDAGGKTGVAAGDAVCQARANAAGLPGTFKAWLSTTTTDAYCRLQGYTGTVTGKCGQSTLPVAAGPWVRTNDGYPFAPTIDTLVNIGQVYAPVRYDENGTAVTNLYYTGTKADGTVAFTCTDWTNGVSGGGSSGSPDGATGWWTEQGGFTCSVTFQLLCFQTGIGAPLPSLPAVPSGAKRVFVTSVQGTGDMSTWTDSGGVSGVAGGDAICQARATAASLANAGNYKAWLSDSTNDAITHVTATATGPWYRMDDVKIADTITDLTTAPLFTAIAVDENSNYVNGAPGYLYVWSGTDETGVKTASLCVDWTDGTSGNTGTIGIANTSNTSWTNFSSLTTCDGFAALYCFEYD